VPGTGLGPLSGEKFSFITRPPGAIFSPVFSKPVFDKCARLSPKAPNSPRSPNSRIIITTSFQKVLLALTRPKPYSNPLNLLYKSWSTFGEIYIILYI
jgi:hypothetical protein